MALEIIELDPEESLYPEFPFGSRKRHHSTSVSLVRHTVKRFSSGAPPTICHAHHGSDSRPLKIDPQGSVEAELKGLVLSLTHRVCTS
jgi:hypothetical protein